MPVAISTPASDPETIKKSDAKEIVPEIVWETLCVAEKEGTTQEYDTAYSNCNLGVIAGDLKMRSHLTAFAHGLAHNKKGIFNYSFSSSQNDDSLDICYAGNIIIDEPVPFEINVKLSKVSKVEIKLGEQDPRKETTPVSMPLRDQIMFVFDYAIADIKDWTEYIESIIADKIAKEDEECELD
jgi:hypothetical protein